MPAKTAPNPRKNADDAFNAFMSMGQNEWAGLLASLAQGGVLEPEEDKGFKRALAERGVGPTIVTKREPAPTARTVAKRAPRRKPTGVGEKLRQFLGLKSQIATLDDRLGEIKMELSQVTESFGYEDDKGNLWFDLPEPVEHEGATYTRMKREKRTGYVLKEDAAEEVLKKRKLWKPVEEGGVLRTILVIDEAEVRTQHFKGVLSDTDIDTCFPAKVTWSFLPQKGK